MATKAETLAKQAAEKEKTNADVADPLVGQEPETRPERAVEKKTVELDFERDLSINKFKLDMECVSHASMYFRYAEAAQQAKARVGELEDKLKLITAEQNIAIRNDFIKQGTKFTESVIDAELTKDERVRKAREQLRNAQTEAATMSVAVSAFDHRKGQLDNLTRLYCSGYWSSVVGGNGQAVGNDRAQGEMRRSLGKSKQESE